VASHRERELDPTSYVVCGVLPDAGARAAAHSSTPRPVRVRARLVIRRPRHQGATHAGGREIDMRHIQDGKAKMLG